MNTEKIAYLIKHPQHISEEDIDVIHELKNKYPYASTAHMLLIKGLANIKSLDFESQLKVSAIHVNDREKLHDLVHLKDDSANIETTKKSIDNVVKTESKQIDDTPIKAIDEKTSVPEKEIIEASKTETTVIKLEEIPKIDLDNQPTKPVKTIKKSIAADDSEKTDMAKIIAELQAKVEEARRKAANPIEKITEPSITKTIAKSQEEEEEVTPINEEIKIIEETKIIEFQDTKTIETPIEEETSIKNTSTPDILNIDVLSHAMETAFELDVDNIIREPEYEDKTTPQATFAEDTTDEGIQTTDINSLSFTEWLKFKQGKLNIISTQNTKNNNVTLTKGEINTLLNKFIDEEPKISRPKKEFYNPVKNAKKSLDESTVLVSETLAKIYWMQKNYDKAIKAYQQLSLLNPKKKSFFANQIKKIKQEIN